MPSIEWVSNNGLGVVFSLALLWIIDRRLGAVARNLERLSLQVGIMLDRSTRASEHAAAASEKAVQVASRALDQNGS